MQSKPRNLVFLFWVMNVKNNDFFVEIEYKRR